MNKLHKKLEKIGSDPKITAKSVGLRYVDDKQKGFHRIKKGQKIVFTDHDDAVVKDKELLAHFKSLVIPPAYDNVWISPFKNSHLQFTGFDAKGRKQYRYHQYWNSIRNQAKFFRLRRFADALPEIRAQVDKDLARKELTYEKVIALVVKLIEITNIRIGNEGYSKLYGSFGLTTLKDKHAKIDGNKISFEFIGKKGVAHKVALNSVKLARLVKKCRDIPGKNLFQYYDFEGNHKSIGSADVNDYLKATSGEDFTAKDFRTWAGTLNALCAFNELGEFKKDSDCKKNVVQVLDYVAKQLGNTRTVCKKYYVHPSIILAYENGSLNKYKVSKHLPSLTDPERILVSILESDA